MGKSVKKVGIALKDASPLLVKQVEAVIADAKKHTFSVSKVYAAYNAVFQLKEKPQTCASCLQNRADKLAKWYGKSEGKVVDLNPAPPVHPNTDNWEEIGGALIIVDGEEHIAVNEDGTAAVVNFTPAEEGAQYGIATDGEGNPAPAFVYKQNGVAYMVSVDGAYTVVTGEPIADVNATAPVVTGEELKHGVNIITEGLGEPVAQDIANLGKLNLDVLQSIEGVTVLKMKDTTAQDVMFVTADKTQTVGVGSKGTVKHLDGTNVKTGTHELLDGTKLAVAVAGKAAIKA